MQRGLVAAGDGLADTICRHHAALLMCATGGEELQMLGVERAPQRTFSRIKAGQPVAALLTHHLRQPLRETR